jgi:hypothetical protein
MVRIVSRGLKRDRIRAEGMTHLLCAVVDNATGGSAARPRSHYRLWQVYAYEVSVGDRAVGLDAAPA